MRRAFILIGLAVSFSQPASAEPTREEVKSGVVRCDGIADNRVWLDCFYGSAQPMRSLLGLTPAPPAQVKLVPLPSAADAGHAFLRPAPQAEKPSGFWADVLGTSKPAASNVPMASYKFARNGTFTVVLQNGQTYRQEESDLVFAKWNRPASSYLVTVAGSADNFVLRIKGRPDEIFHVRRL